MTTVIANSALLSLSSLLLSDADDCLPSGAHLRWAISPELGFPYAGFRVRMRPAPSWPWPKDQNRTVFFTRQNVATSVVGVHIADAPIRVSGASVTDNYWLTCEPGSPMRFTHEQREREDPLFAPWVRFAVILGQRSSPPPSPPPPPVGPIRPPIDVRPLPGPIRIPPNVVRPGVVQPGVVHPDVLDKVKPLLTEVKPIAPVSGGILKKILDIKQVDERGPIVLPKKGTGKKVHIKGLTKRDGEELVVDERTIRFDELPHFNPGKPTERVAMVSGDELHAVTVDLEEGLEIMGIAYCTAEQAHHATGWKTIAWQQPLCNPGTADVAAPADVKDLARKRLRAMRPLRRPADPAFEPAGPSLSATDHQRFEDKLMDEAIEIAGALTRAFRMEIDDKVPPGRVTVADIDDSEDARPDEGSIDLPFHGLLQAGAFADHVAAMLGLGLYENMNARADQHFDFEVDVVMPTVWLSVATQPSRLHNKAILSRIPSRMISPGGSEQVFDRPPAGFVSLVAFSIERAFKAPQPVLAPVVTVDAIADASRMPIQARTSIAVYPQEPEMRPLLWREDSRGNVPIGPKDSVAGLLVPALANERGACRYTDNDLPRYGAVKYRGVNIDSFGRASPPTTKAATVEDKIPPVAPGRPDIQPGEPSASDLNHFPDVTVTFDWTDAMKTASPDVVRFHLLWRAGSVDAGAVEQQPDGRLSIDWPAAPDQTVEVFTGGVRIVSNVDVRARQDGLRQEWTMVCLAEDSAGNLSAPSSPAHQVVVPPLMPPAPTQPPEPQWTAWPDAAGDARYRVKWTVPSSAAGARVSSASESRIVNLAGIDRAAHYALAPNERADALKALAVGTPNAFVPEAPTYPVSSTSHDIVLKAASTDLRVVLVEFISKTGQKASWPAQKEAFAVVRARPAPVLGVPVMQVERDGDAMVLSAIAAQQGTGTIEIFALTSPAQAEVIAVIPPAGVISTDAGETVRHVPAANSVRWVGYACRLLAADGRRSALSDIVWREVAAA